VVRHKVRCCRGWGGKIRRQKERGREPKSFAAARNLLQLCNPLSVSGRFLHCDFGFCTTFGVKDRQRKECLRVQGRDDASGGLGVLQVSPFLQVCDCVCVCFFSLLALRLFPTDFVSFLSVFACCPSSLPSCGFSFVFLVQLLQMLSCTHSSCNAPQFLRLRVLEV
jgi:hypothetical protein